MNPVVVEQIRSTVEARLRELEPVLTELEQLQGLLAVLDDPGGYRGPVGDPATVHGPLAALIDRAQGAAPADVTPLQRPQRLGSKRGRDGRAPQGANKQRILAVIAAHPGIAAPQIAESTGLKRPIVASTISRLKRTGELCAYEKGVRVPAMALGGSSERIFDA